MKYLETEEEKNHLQSHQLFCDSICSVLLLRINFFRSLLKMELP
jgi:hypothetical protein